MRQGVEIETTAMARRRLLMNYEWFPELLSQLPDAVKVNYYCKKLLLHLAELADYMSSVGPWKMSKKKLSQVLSTFRPWELHNPDIKTAIQVCVYVLHAQAGCDLTAIIASSVPDTACDIHRRGRLQEVVGDTQVDIRGTKG